MNTIKIVIHGTQFGYNIMYPTQQKEQVAGFKGSDIRGNSNSIGQQAYYIYFNDGHVVFSKYKIIRDVVGDKRVGSIAFSVVIPNDKKLSGKDVWTLLKQLSDEFCKRHIVNNNLDKFREDWAFVDDIVASYKPQQMDKEKMQSGTEEAAYIYYTDEAQLQKYFDDPYEEAYEKYKQVYFVDKKLEPKPENPLNALRYNPEENLTEKIDLENPRYTLLISPSVNTIEVKANGSIRSNRDKIRKKEVLQISYTRDCYISETKTGTWDEISREFVEVDKEKRTVTIQEYQLKPDEKTIHFQIKDYKGNPITYTKIQIGTAPCQEMNISEFGVKCKGEKLKESWTISVEKENFQPKRESFVPKQVGGVVVITLQKYKEVEVLAEYDGKAIQDLTIIITQQNDPTKEIQVNGKDKITFTDAQIDAVWIVRVEHDDYESESQKFCPADKDKITIPLKKSPKYYIDPKEGTRKEGRPKYSRYRDGRDVESCIKPPKGYLFDGFEFVENNQENQDDDGTFNVKYKKNKSLFFGNKKWLSIGGIVGTIAIVASILFLGSDNYEESQHQPQPLQQQQHSNECEQPDEQSSTNEENQYKQRYQKQQYDDECEQVEEQSSESETI